MPPPAATTWGVIVDRNPQAAAMWELLLAGSPQAAAMWGVPISSPPQAVAMWELLLAGGPQAAATLTELRFPSPGLRAKHATLGMRPTNLATLQELRLAVGVILNLMISTNPFLPIILLRVTPSANRNTLPFRVAKRRAGDLRFSVAILLWFNTQGRGAAHLNPGLGKRNSYRVAAACGLAALRRRGVHHSLLCPALPALLFATPLPLLASPASPPASRRLSRSIAMPALRSAPSQLDAKSPPSSLGLR